MSIVNSYATRAALKAAPADGTAFLVGDASTPNGEFFFVAGDFTGFDNDLNIVESDNSSLSAGAWVRQGSFSLEDFGAVGDGVTDDSAALLLAIEAQQLTGVPIIFVRQATYAMNSDIGVTLSRDLEIIGNGATLTLLSAPTQSDGVGATKPFFKVDGTSAGHATTIQNLTIDLGGFEAAGLFLYRTRVTIDRCIVGNGGKGTLSSFGIFLNACSGSVRENVIRNCFYGIFYGWAKAGYGCDGLRVTGNDVRDCFESGDEENAGDALGGILRNGVIAFNRIDNCFAGVMLAAYETGGERSENVEILGNVISGHRGHGIQLGDTSNSYRNRRLHVADNQVDGAAANGAAIYCVFADDVTIKGNQAKGGLYGVSIGAAARVTVMGFHSRGRGTASGNGYGIGVDPGAGAVSDVCISDCSCSNHERGLLVVSGSEVMIRGGNYGGNGRGVHILGGSGGLWGVTAFGCVTEDINVTDSIIDWFVGEDLSYGTQSGLTYRDLTGATPTISRWPWYRITSNITSISGGVVGRMYRFTASGSYTIPQGGQFSHGDVMSKTLGTSKFIQYLVRPSNVWTDMASNF